MSRCFWRGYHIFPRIFLANPHSPHLASRARVESSDADPNGISILSDVRSNCAAHLRRRHSSASVMSRGRGNAGLPLLIIALLLHTSRAQNDTSSPVATTQATSLPITGAACTLNADGSYSGAGTCTGPVQRSEVRYGNLSITNGGTGSPSRKSISSSHEHPPGCPADQLLFYVDGDMAQPKVQLIL